MVYIIILNWNGWADTIECLESVLRNDYTNFKVIVVDNNSKDESLELIKAWANSRLNVSYNKNNPLLQHIYPPIVKPVSFIEYDQNNSIAESNTEDENVKVTILQSGANRGYAGGNNVGLKYALTKNDFEYAWLLNNDTVIKNDSLQKLILRIKETKNVGILGSTLLYYSNPKVVQALGGATYNKWFATTRHVGLDSSINEFTQVIENDILFDYIVGASMLVPKQFLGEVGLMDESYFLYYEELDWALRGKSNNWRIAFAKDSLVYHKVGKSIGSSDNSSERSEMSDYFQLRNRIAITRKFFPGYTGFVYLSFLIVIFNRIRRGQSSRLLRFLTGKYL